MRQKTKILFQAFATISAVNRRKSGKNIILTCLAYLIFILLNLNNGCLASSFTDIQEKKGKFVFPKNAFGSIEMSHEHFKWLLASDKYSRMDAMESNQYANYC